MSDVKFCHIHGFGGYALTIARQWQEGAENKISFGWALCVPNRWKFKSPTQKELVSGDVFSKHQGRETAKARLESTPTTIDCPKDKHPNDAILAYVNSHRSEFPRNMVRLVKFEINDRVWQKSFDEDRLRRATQKVFSGLSELVDYVADRIADVCRA